MSSPVPAAGTCVVCASVYVTEVDRWLVAGVAAREIARRTGIDRSAIGRHKLKHSSLRAVEEELEEVAEAEHRRIEPVEVHGRLSALADRLESVLKFNAKTPARATQLANVSRELRQCLEAIARLQADPDLRIAMGRDAMALALAEAEGRELGRRLTITAEAVFAFVSLDHEQARLAEEVFGGVWRLLIENGWDEARGVEQLPAYGDLEYRRDQFADARWRREFEPAVAREVARRIAEARAAMDAERERLERERSEALQRAEVLSRALAASPPLKALEQRREWPGMVIDGVVVPGPR